MPAYIIANIEVTDPEGYKAYTELTPAIIEAHGGKFLVRGGPVVTLEGAQDTRRLVVLEFPSVAAAQAFYDSEAYSAAKALREGTANALFSLVEGVQ